MAGRSSHRVNSRLSAFVRWRAVSPAVVSIGVSIVLECRGLHKRFAVGAGSCGASAHVLRGVDLSLSEGECLAVVGTRGAGKSTLLLCAAGLLRPEAGEVRWFGQAPSAKARKAVLYHWTPTDFERASTVEGVGIHLVDFAFAADWPPRFTEWIERRRDRGEPVPGRGADLDAVVARRERG